MNTDEPTDNRIAKSYVWHEGKCFFISTIERTSSSAYNPCRYNETIVWAYDWDKRELGAMLHIDEAPRGSIQTHQRVCDALYRNGKMPDES